MHAIVKVLVVLLGVRMVFNTAYAMAGPYVGLVGGYNAMTFPEHTFKTTVVIPGFDPDADTNTTKLTTRHVFSGLYLGYLFHLSHRLRFGPQLGYVDYGRVVLLNEPNAAATGRGYRPYGGVRVAFSAINLFAVFQYEVDRYIFQTRVGVNDMIATERGCYCLVDEGGSVHRQNIVGKNTLNLALGFSVGKYITQHISLAVSYDHIFGERYTTERLSHVGDYAKTVYIKAPSMDLFGVAVAYHF